jgi:hypothetical protein
LRASILKPFKIFWQAIVLWWDSWLELLILNTIVVLCWFTVILGPPATFALYAYIHDYLEEGTSSGLRGMWPNAKKYAVRSYLWFAVNLLVFFISLFAYSFYMNLGQVWSVVLGYVMLLLFAGWFFFVQFYTIPYLLQQEKHGVGLAWRNATLTVLAWPYYALVLVLLSNLLAVVGFLTLAGLLAFIPVLPAITASLAVRDRLEAAEAIRAKP